MHGAYSSRSADMSTTIGRDHVVNLVTGNPHPFAVHFDLVLVAHHAALGRATIHQVAARALAVISFERRVEALMPFIVACPVISFLRRPADSEGRCDQTVGRKSPHLIHMFACCPRRSGDMMSHGRDVESPGLPGAGIRADNAPPAASSRSAAGYAAGDHGSVLRTPFAETGRSRCNNNPGCSDRSY
jgi:hypothetical protein